MLPHSGRTTTSGTVSDAEGHPQPCSRSLGVHGAGQIVSSDPAGKVTIVDFQTPWRVGTRADGELEGQVLNAIGDIVVDPYGSTVIPEQEYMRRIVVCVNACAGLSDAELASLKPGELAVAVLERKGVQLHSAHDGLELERHPEPRLLPVDPLEAGDIPEREVYIAALVAEAQAAAFRELDWKDGTGFCKMCQMGSLGGREIEHTSLCWVGRMLGLVKRLTTPFESEPVSQQVSDSAQEQICQHQEYIAGDNIVCLVCGATLRKASPLKSDAVIEYEVEGHPWASEEGNAPPAKRVVTHEQAAAAHYATGGVTPANSVFLVGEQCEGHFIPKSLAPAGQRDLLNPYLRRCERHDVLLRLEEVRDQPGYTFYVCDACEREKQQRLKDLFPRMEALA